jgi:hypothetical protein
MFERTRSIPTFGASMMLPSRRRGPAFEREEHFLLY